MINDNNKITSILIALLIFLFLVSGSAYFILQTQGKRITRTGIIQETNVVRVNSNNKAIDLLVNQTRYNINNKVIQNVPLGIVNFEVTKDGYTTWTKELNISKGKVEDIYPVLFPTQRNVEVIYEANIDQTIYSDDKSMVYFTEIDEANNITIYKYRILSRFPSIGSSDVNELTKVQTDKYIEQFDSYSMKLSQGGQTLYIELSNFDEKQFLLIDTSSGQIREFTTTYGFEPDSINWIGNTKNMIVELNNTIIELSHDGSTQTLISFNADKSTMHCVTNDHVYAVNTNRNEIDLYRRGRKSQVELISDSEITVNSDLEIFCGGDPKRFLIKSLEGIFFVDTSTDELIKIDIDGQILGLSQDSRNFAYQIGNDVYLVRTLTRSRKTDIKIAKSSDLTAGSFIFHKYINNQLILIEKDDELQIRDADSENTYVLYTTDQSKHNSIMISQDNTTVFAVIFDKDYVDNENNNLSKSSQLIKFKTN